MSHHHHHHSDKNIKTAFFLNLSFTLIEIVGGILTNSVAIMADAIHDLGDSISLGVAWYLQRLSKKSKNSTYTYGYKRFSILGALITSMVLIIGSVIILTRTIPRFTNPEPTSYKGMLLLAVLGVLVNGAAVLKTRKGSSLNERVVSLHLLEDVLGWIAVLIGSIIMYFFDFPWIDPLLSLLISIYVLKNVVVNLRQVIRIIMQGVPTDFNLTQVKEVFAKFKEIRDYKDLHLWSLDGEHHILSVNLVIDPQYNLYEINRLKESLKSELKDLDIDHTTIEFDY